MAPTAKITKDMIISAGMTIIRSEGEYCLNVRKIAAKLDCSTRPVMYYYNTMDELKSAVYEAADEFHTQYIMTPTNDTTSLLLSIGLRYIQFAAEEKNLFRFLFQSDKFQNTGFYDILAVQNNPVIQPICESIGVTEEQAKEIFEMLFICVHGVASLIANNSVSYDEQYYEKLLTNTLYGAVSVIKGGHHK